MYHNTGTGATVDGEFTDGNPATGVPRSLLGSTWVNMMQREGLALLAAADITPDPNDFSQWAQAVQLIAGGVTSAALVQPFLVHTAAATCDLGAAVAGQTSRNATVVGTTAITSFGSSASTDAPIYLVTFAGSLTLTYNAASMILPGGASISTAAGDALLAQYRGSGNWTVLAYFPRTPAVATSGVVAGRGKWRRSADGTIEQWGYLAASNGEFLLPIPFPNVFDAVYVSAATAGGAYSDTPFAYPVGLDKFFAATDSSEGGEGGYPLYFHAIGS